MLVQFDTAALTASRREFNNHCNAVAIRRGVPLMNFQAPGNQVIADCPVSHSKHHSATSVYRLLGLSTPAKLALELLTTPFHHSPPDRTYRATSSKLSHPFSVIFL
jgi:hypothetical protein